MNVSKKQRINFLVLNPRNGDIIGFSIIGLILVADQLLLPMFHIGSLPYKVSYFLAFFWLISFIALPKLTLKFQVDRNDFLSFTFAILVIVFCGFLGDLFINLFSNVESYSESFKSYSIYFFAILSFGLGLSSKKFKYSWLIYILFISVIINLLFIFYKSTLPQILIDFYYPEMTVKKFNLDEIDSINAILELSRPRGMFSNPNGSAFMVNIIALFIYVSIKNELLIVKPNLIAVLIIILPVITCVLLSSRGEIIVSFILGYLNYRNIFKYVGVKKKIGYFGISILLLLVSSFAVIQKLDSESSILTNLDRAYSIFQFLNKNEEDDVYEKRNQGVSRPLLMIETASQRFIHSPLFGSGFSVGNTFPFDHGTQFYHNDWLRLIVTSGIIGFFSMIWIIRKFCIKLSPILIIPFILPGLVNTFLLNMPVVMFYFFMIGLMRGHLREWKNEK